MEENQKWNEQVTIEEYLLGTLRQIDDCIERGYFATNNVERLRYTIDLLEEHIRNSSGGA